MAGQQDQLHSNRKDSTIYETIAIVELGGAFSWSLKAAKISYSPTLAVEITPIENWLELEAGIVLNPDIQYILNRMGF